MAGRPESIGVARRWLLLETSGRVGEVGVAEDGRLVTSTRLDGGRQHARDLTPAVAALIDGAGWRPKDVSAVAVSIGPGSYTGLRVGVMTAKAWAYATGCEVAAVPTFHVIAGQADVTGNALDVIADALKGKLYAQPFARAAEGQAWQPAGKLVIVASDEWRRRRRATAFVTGPAVRPTDDWPNVVPESRRHPRVETLLALAATGAYALPNGLVLEPLYMRPSSAEEQWDARPTGH